MDAFICDAIRSPIGKYGGALSSQRPDDLLAHIITALMERNPNIDPAQIDEVIIGAANQSGEDNRNTARMAALIAGLPASVPGVTVNRLCASGLEAVGQAARAIKTGEANLVLAGGAESLTRAPFVIGKAETSWGRGPTMYDTTMGWRFVNQRLEAAHGTETMPQTAENIAEKFNITRQEQDRFALHSHQKAGRAQQSGVFSAEITPIETISKKTTILIDEDETIRPDTSLEKLANLKPVVKATGTITAGNASSINDGAAAMIVASQSACHAFDLTARARIVGMASSGIAPSLMGLGPIDACNKLLDRSQLSLAQMDVIELNEAFAAQSLGVLRGLNIADDDERVNPNGGALALGHPLGMSGARLALTATRQLHAVNGHYALITLCVGVGQGLAMIIERV